MKTIEKSHTKKDAYIRRFAVPKVIKRKLNVLVAMYYDNQEDALNDILSSHLRDVPSETKVLQS